MKATVHLIWKFNDQQFDKDFQNYEKVIQDYLITSI